MVKNLWIMRSMVEANGTVVANRRQRIDVRGGQRVTFFAIVEFSDPNGVMHRVEASIGHDKPTAIGTNLSVLYPPGNPAQARAGGSDLWGIPLGLAGFGIVFVGCGCFLISASRWLVRRGVPMRT